MHMYTAKHNMRAGVCTQGVHTRHAHSCRHTYTHTPARTHTTNTQGIEERMALYRQEVEEQARAEVARQVCVCVCVCVCTVNMLTPSAGVCISLHERESVCLLVI